MNVVIVEFLESGRLEGFEEALRLEQHVRRLVTTIRKSYVLLGKFDLILLAIDRLLLLLLQALFLSVGEVQRFHGVAVARAAREREKNRRVRTTQISEAPWRMEE